MHSTSSLRVVLPDLWQEGGFGLYVHWPFCAAKCPYCDFNSHVESRVDQDRWAKALSSEISRWADRTPDRVLSSIFFGGGTPSLMVPETVETVLEAARRNWVWSNNIEITLEANPGSVELERFSGYSDAGVNRVSLGVQALDDNDLRRLGRVHDVDCALKALDVARSNFSRVSFDLIYARQGQSLMSWETELRTALDMRPDHLSLYQLTIEPGTAFWDRQKAGGLRGLPDEDLSAEMFEVTQSLCSDHGLPAYEVSNHAVDEAQSRHNLIYWNSGDWVGVGPGAHGRVTEHQSRRSTVAYAQPAKWLAEAEAGSGDAEDTPLDQADHFGEYLMMGLRLTEGLDLARSQQFDQFKETLPTIGALAEQGLLWINDTRFGATSRGRMLLNRVVAELIPDAS